MELPDIDIISEIYNSKKYSSIYQPFLERVCNEESVKYKKNKEIIKAVKNRLHTVYGAFFFDNSVKLADDLINNINNNNDEEIFLDSMSEKLMNLNTSSRERLSFIKELYKFIYDNIAHKNINTILDIGCGFNPFSLPFICESFKNIKSYYAFDIDVNLAKIINKYFDLFNFPQYAGCIDIISETPAQKADIAFLFKIIPTVENCKKGRGFEIINNLDAKYIIVSFPTKTLCGKNIGMAKNYAASFEENLDCEKFAVIGKEIFANELVYVLGRNA